VKLQHQAPEEPVPSADDRTGSTLSAPGGLPALQGPLDIARGWAGSDRLALIVGGSHAAGEALWVTYEGRAVCLSDLDVYAVVRDSAAKQAAIARARSERAGLGARLLTMGLAAPLEVGFHTPADLAALPARPGTLELRRSGRVVDGDPAWRDRVPAWTARDVSSEEIWLLHENRAFELLWASSPASADPPGLGALRRRHAVLKCAIDLATVMALAAGEYPGSAAERVAWARPRWGRPGNPEGAPEPPWPAALAWRGGDAEALAPEAAAAERMRTVAAWVATWHGLAGRPPDPSRPFASVLSMARRARLRRRLREALLPDVKTARMRHPGGRLRHALDGTPRHRLNAAATAVLMFEALGPDGSRAAMERELNRVLRRLGVDVSGADRGADLVRAWDMGFLDGQRTEGWA
jgi:hypothetical protein